MNNTVFDNGNTHAISSGDGWTPKSDGKIYCSPACGFHCAKADFDHANERAAAIAAQLGSGWEPRVWENCGWNFEVTKGFATVTAEEGGYCADLRFEMTEGHVESLDAFAGDPRTAVEAVGNELKRRIATLERSFMSVSLDVIEIGFNELDVAGEADKAAT